MSTLKDIIAQYIQSRRASRYSEHTLQDYQNAFRLFSEFVGEDIVFEDIDVQTITRFMASEHVRRVSKKTARNYHTALSSLWTWAVENGHATINVVRKVKPPKPEKREIIPFSRDEIEKLLDACMGSANPQRDRAILYLLLDTGMRASEIGNLRIQDLNVYRRHILVMGKGRKERQVRISERTLQAILEYLRTRGISNLQKHFHAPLITTHSGHQLDRNALRLLLFRLGARAGIPKVHPHRFRHTFAITYLRNGGNIYTLQKILGHTSLDMVKRYLKIAQIDIDRDHDKASPVANWKL
ncbi:MAG: hypothetical protein D6770_02760 [Anaerolineae bacterium]|nr:MAG: hypothetical protein D6770_02760 [Anaerolineae bacterium]